jgi:hypothetical protein
MALARRGLLLVTAVLILLAVAAGAALAAKPQHVMIVVMDQMKPSYAKKYDMANILWLQNNGVNFPNAWVGQMASETVVSHNVMVSGLYPKNMGWSDEAFRDVDDVLGLGEDEIITSGDLGYNDYVKLIQNMDYPKLGDYLHHKYPGTIVANVGEKGYQVESMAASSSDIYVRFGSKKKVVDLADPTVVPWTGTYRGPSGSGPGGKLPAYIANDPRFLASVANDLAPAAPNDYYGTKTDWPAWMYPEDGRYVAGPYPTNLSGDTWVADAALKIMDNENWTGLWVTFSAIDKVGHMWGGGDVDTVENFHWDPNSLFAQVHMPWAAKTADDQLGRLIAKLKEKGLFDSTLIVVTADHGSTYGNKGFYGTNAYDGANTGGWYAGTYHVGTAAGTTTTAGPEALKPLMDTGKVEFSYQSTAIESWLKLDSRSWADKLSVARTMKALPGVIATFIRRGDYYTLATKSSTMTKSEKAWFDATAQEAVDGMAWDGAADVVGLLANQTVYAAFGDHGGAQKDVQRIPLVFYNSGIKHRVDQTNARLIDIMPTILKAMSIRQMEATDGMAFNLKKATPVVVVK